MRMLYFENYEELAINIADKYDEVKNSEDLNSIDIVAKYEGAKEIIRELIAIGYGIAFINISDSEWDGYEDEFIISLYDNEIWCEKAKRDGRYITSEAKVVYLFGNCNSKIVPLINSDEIYEIEVGNDDCDCENCNCMNSDNSYVHLSDDNDGNTHGFTASKSDGDSYVSYSYYTSDNLSQDDIQKMLKAFGF